ncbi:MAG: hypothetical protein L0154_04040, partial [Chloroflexi bacterium]|nr:hypothetical protein [Chloroflexota bacterium]
IPTRYTYDGLGRLITIERNDEVIGIYQYDASNHVTVVTNESNRQASYVYDNFGQLTTVVDFDGTFETFIYNPFGNLRTSIDSLGYTTIYDYDELNRVTGITDPIGYRAEFDWRDDGRLIFDDSRLETTFYYDPLGRLWQIRGLQGDGENIHRFDYDFNSYLETFGPWDDRFTYTFEEDDQGQVTSISGPDEWALGFAYDDLGRLVGRSTALETTELDYDRVGRLTAIGDKTYTYTPGSIEISPDGEVLTYDSLYRLLSDTGRTIIYSSDGQTITINYDDGFYDVITFADAVTDVQAFMTLEHYTPDDVLFRERQYILNVRGDLIMQRVIDYFEDEQRYVQEFAYSYDAVGRPIRFVDANNNLYFYSYDTKGDLISVQFPDGNVYQYGYDALRNLISITNPAGQIVRLANSPAGEVEQISLNGQTLERYVYSDLGWLVERSFVDFAQSNATTGSGELTFSYDAMGMPTGWQIDDSPLGQITSRCVADLTQGVAWRYLFDDDGRVERVTTLEGGCQGEVIQRLPVAYDSRDRLITNSILEHSYSYEDGTYTLTTMYESGETIIITFDDYLHVESIEVEGEVIDVEYSSAQLDLNMLEVQLTWGDRYISNVRFNRNDQTTRIEYLDQRDPTFFLPVRYTVTYDGLPLSIIEPLRNNIVVGYDSARRPLSTVWLFAGRASEGQTGTVDYSFTLTYDNLGNRIRESLQFPNGEQFEYEYIYDEGDLLVERRLATDDMTSADSSVASTQGYIGIAGIILVIVVAVTFRRRLTLRYVVSGVVLVVIISSVAFAQTGTRYQYTYNGRGHVATVTIGSSEQLAFDYDAFGRIVSIVNSNGEESTFTYNGFYQLASYTTTAGTFEYVYDAGRPVGVRMDGELKIFAGIFNDQPLLMKSENESQWLLFDGQGTLRQTFVGEHTSGENTVNSGTDILGRSVHPVDSLASLPAGIPVFNGMLFDETSNMLVTLDGRVYDPLVGRYLQRDVLGPDASGNIYGYAPLRDEPPVANRVTYPFVEAFQLLLDLNQRLATPMVEDVFEDWMPDPDRFWQDSRLATLNDFNVGISGFTGRHLELPHFVGNTYNPPGVVVGPDGNFGLFDLTGSQRVDVQPLLPNEFDTAGSSSLLPDLTGLYGLAAGPDFVQDWYDASDWQERTQVAYTGLPSVDSIDPYLDTYFQNALLYGELFTVLEDMPGEAASTWQAMVEAENMPDVPELFPADPRAWLEQWLTTDTIPTWTQLRNIYAQQPVPGSAARDVRLPVEGN